MSNDLPVLEPIKPVAKCGLCGRKLYPESMPTHKDCDEQCPLNGEDWAKRRYLYRAQNAWIGQEPTQQFESDAALQGDSDG